MGCCLAKCRERVSRKSSKNWNDFDPDNHIKIEPIETRIQDPEDNDVARRESVTPSGVVNENVTNLEFDFDAEKKKCETTNEINLEFPEAERNRMVKREDKSATTAKNPQPIPPDIFVNSDRVSLSSDSINGVHGDVSDAATESGEDLDKDEDVDEDPNHLTIPINDGSIHDEENAVADEEAFKSLIAAYSNPSESEKPPPSPETNPKFCETFMPSSPSQELSVDRLSITKSRSKLDSICEEFGEEEDEDEVGEELDLDNR